MIDDPNPDIEFGETGLTGSSTGAGKCEITVQSDQLQINGPRAAILSRGKGVKSCNRVPSTECFEHSLNWQAAGRPAQIFVVSHGSQPEVNRERIEPCAIEDATLITVGDLRKPWNRRYRPSSSRWHPSPCYGGWRHASSRTGG